jgi:hypothetical protein
MIFDAKATSSVSVRSVRASAVGGSEKNQLRTLPVSMSKRWIRNRLMSTQ